MLRASKMKTGAQNDRRDGKVQGIQTKSRTSGLLVDRVERQASPHYGLSSSLSLNSHALGDIASSVPLRLEYGFRLSKRLS